jgi:gas vesicle protein
MGGAAREIPFRARPARRPSRCRAGWNRDSMDDDERGAMPRSQDLIFGMLLGAGTMYLLDPDRGRQRRELLRRQLSGMRQELEGLGESVVSQARQLRGAGAVTPVPRPDREEADDATLAARVRASLVTLVSNPATVGIAADHGRITLTGTVVAREVDTLVDGVESLDGVVDVINRLHVEESPGDIPDPRGTGA